MDYDESDFQNQNFQLGSENNKFSSGLPSFSLPKFDIDEVNLRFDSIIESEDILGIHNQEENNWIENYSRVNSGLDTHNVWSEATSSESVEMLLKSVGQEEMIIEQNIVENRDACDGFGILTKEGQPISVQDDFPISKVENNLGDSALLSGSLRDLEPKHSLAVINGRSFMYEKCIRTKSTVGTHAPDRFEAHDDSVASKSKEVHIPSAQVSSKNDQKGDKICELDVVVTCKSNVGNLSNYTLNVDSMVEMNEVRDASSDAFSIENTPYIGEFGRLTSSDMSCHVSSGSSEILSSPIEKINIVDATSQRLISGRGKQGASVEDKEHLYGRLSSSKVETEAIEKKTGTVDMVGNLSNNNMVNGFTSTNLVHVPQSVAIVDEANAGVGAFSVEPCEGTLITSPVQVEPLSKVVKNLESSNALSNCLDRPAVAKRTIILPIDSDNNENQVENSLITGKNGSLSPLGQSSAAELMLPSSGSVYVKSVPTEDVPDFTNLESNSILDRTGDNTEDNVAIDLAEQQPTLPVEDSTLLVEEKNMATGISMNSSLSMCKESTFVAKVLDPSPEVIKVSDHSLCLNDTSNTTCANEPQTHVDIISLRCSKILEECVIIHDSPNQKKDGSLLCEKPEKVSDIVSGNPLHDLEKSCIPATICEDGAPSTDSDVRDCGSPTAFSCMSIPQSEKEQLEHSQGLLDQGVLVFNNSKEPDKFSSSADLKENNNPEDDKSFTFEVNSLSDPSQKETDKGWKPFPSIQCYAYPMIGEGTTTTSNSGEDNSRTSIEVSLASSRISRGSDDPPINFDVKHYEEGAKLDQTVHACSEKITANSEGLESIKNETTEAVRSFEFDVNSFIGLSQSEVSNRWKPSSTIQSHGVTEAVMVHPTTTMGLCESNRNVLQESCQGTPRTPSVKGIQRNCKLDGEIGTGQLSGKLTEKENSNVRKARKEATNSKQKSGRESNSFTTSTAGSITNSSSISTSNLPDLNTSSFLSGLHQQPFTDFQQVQLRAQIFVYGSLIQGAAPNEACMISAFAENVPDGGRSIWENLWRIAVDKFRLHKSPLSTPETPLSVKSTARVPEQLNRHSVTQSEVHSTPVRDNSRGISLANINPLVQLSSPLWTISTSFREGSQSSVSMPPPVVSHQSIYPSQPYQSPQSRHFERNTQHTHTWFSPALSPASSYYPSLSVSDSVHVTSTREPNVPSPSMIPHLPSSPFVHSGAPLSISSGTPLPMESIRTTIPVDSKPKRRKNNPLEDFGRSSFVQTQTDLLPHFTNITSSFTLTTPSATVKGPTASSFMTSSPVTSTNYQVTGVQNAEQRAALSEETYGKIEQAKLQAEEAAAYAVSTVNHSQSIWGQLAIQKNMGLASDVEAKLASSAVAIAAAASVAKAAAAAAKVAYDAALQAKMMADEALATSISGNSNTDASVPLGYVSPGSILQGKASILGTTREVTRKRVEATSTAAKRAENLDAVVKAAEIAAEAVSQAGTIIAMGEPIPFSINQLSEAGPESYWKGPQTTSKEIVAFDRITTDKCKLDALELPSNLKKSTDIVETCASAPESIVGPMDTSVSARKEFDGDMPARSIKDNPFTEGTLVEVLSSEDGLGRIWCPAKILGFEGGRANVCYTQDSRKEGSSFVTELVAFEGEGDIPPRIRIPHPMSDLKYKGAKKRNRKVLGDYAWSVGDKVDTFVNDRWREGVIVEKCKDDETNIMVCFTGQGETSTVKVWSLRPTSVWEDGAWKNFNVSNENFGYNHEGGSQEKPLKKMKYGYAEIDPVVDVKGKGKLEPSQTLKLSAKERMFSAGQNNKEHGAPRTNRSGIVKEGPGAVSGIPKPGKKRKLMDVSTQSVIGKNGTSNGNGSVKSTKYSAPQGLAPRGWKLASKIVSKENQVTQLKPKVPRFAKPASAAGKVVSEKDPTSNFVFSANAHGSGQDHLPDRRSVEGIASSSVPGHSWDAPVSKKKSSVVDHSKGKTTPCEKTINDDSDAYYNDNSGTRRSNRRIQPTSRLLEGIQSSFTISKIPAAPHDRGSKSQARSAFSRGTCRG